MSCHSAAHMPELRSDGQAAVSAIWKSVTAFAECPELKIRVLSPSEGQQHDVDAAVICSLLSDLCCLKLCSTCAISSAAEPSMECYLYIMYYIDFSSSAVLLRSSPRLSAHVSVEFGQRTGARFCLLLISAGDCGLCLLPAVSH